MNAVARLKAMLGLDTKEFKAGVRDAKSTTGTLASSMKSIKGVIAGAFSVGAVIAFGRSLMNTASEIADFANNLNLTVKDVGGLSVAAAKAGVPLQQIGAMLGKLATAQIEVAKGNAESIDSFARLGVSVDQVMNADPVQLLELVAIGARDSATAVADLGDMFGERMGTKTRDLLAQIANEGIPEITDATEDAIKKVDAFADAWTEWFSAFKLDIIGAAVELLGKFGEKVKNLIPEIEYKVTPKADQAEWDEFRKFVENEQATGTGPFAGKQSEQVEKAKTEEEKDQERRNELLAIQSRERSKKVQEQIDQLRAERDRAEGRSSGTSTSFNQDSLRSMGGLVGRDLPMMPIMERQLKAATETAMYAERMASLLAEQVSIQTSLQYRN